MAHHFRDLLSGRGGGACGHLSKGTPKQFVADLQSWWLFAVPGVKGSLSLKTSSWTVFAFQRHNFKSSNTSESAGGDTVSAAAAAVN